MKSKRETRFDGIDSFDFCRSRFEALALSVRSEDCERSGPPEWRVEQYPGVRRSPVPICFTPAALSTLLRTVGSKPPESGAKGFGPADRFGFDLIEFDEQGSRRAGGAVYSPDVEWGEERLNYHLNRPEEEMRLWTGDLHSHPGGFGRPSSKSGPGLGDLGYVEEVFAQNPTMEYFAIPIVTNGGSGEVVIHPWVCSRNDPHTPMIAELVICDVERFPKREFNPEWLASIEPANTPNAALASIGSRVAPRNSNQGNLRADYLRRLQGLVSDTFHTKSILTVGLGAGSYAVEKLARLCPRQLKICDFDIVEASNLSRTVYELADIGIPKVEALARRLRAVNPLVEILPFPRSITEMAKDELDDMFEGVDLVVAGTDRFEAQALINANAVARMIPAVFVGVHAHGDGGRLVWYVPGETGCYRCVSPQRYESASDSSQGGTDLDGAVGSIIDGQFIDMIALKITAAILERDQSSRMGSFYEGMSGRNEVVIRCHPAHEWGGSMWNAVLADLPTKPRDYAAEIKRDAIFAMDTLWLKGPRDPSCPICGGVRAHSIEDS